MVAGLLLGPAYATQTWVVIGLDGNNQEIEIRKDYNVFLDTSESTCEGGQQWCLRTYYSSVKLAHYHFLEDYEGDERPAVARIIERDYPDAEMSRPPSILYNCHSCALYMNYQVWLVDQPTALAYDFIQCAGGMSDLYQVGMVCSHGSGHSSRILSLYQYGGSPASAVHEVGAKWGAYPAYMSDHRDDPYAPPAAIFKEKAH